MRTLHDDRLVLLGTAGGAAPTATRCGYANAVVVGDGAYLVDAGEGVHTQLWRAGLTASRRFGGDRPLIEAIALTHLHADHIMDLANILQGSWPASGLDIYGPGPAGPPYTTHDDAVQPVRFADDSAPGIRRVLEYLHRAFALNINSRIIAERRPDYLDYLRVHEISPRSESAGHPDDIAIDLEVPRDQVHFDVPAMEPFVVRPQDARGVTITAVLVQHAPVFPALAYRFDTPSGSVVFSGDTGPCDNVVRLAAGADYLVHEVIDVDALLVRFAALPNYADVERQLSSSHTPVAEVGSLAQRAGVATLVLSHLVPAEAAHDTATWEAMASEGFDGRVVCGVDLDEFPIG